MQTYHFGHLTLPSFSTAHVALVRDLGNASAILEDVKSGGQRFGDMPMALVDARMITSADHILVAVHQAMLRNARGHQESAGSRGLRTKSIHSEVLWNLSATNNIAESFRTFGLSISTKDLLLIHITNVESGGGPAATQVLERIEQIVEGNIDPMGLEALQAWRQGSQSLGIPDWAAIAKAYRLTDLRAVDGEVDQGEDPHLAWRERIDAMTTSMVAMKYVAS